MLLEALWPAARKFETEIPEADPATTAMLLEEQKPIILNDIEKETRFRRYRRTGAATTGFGPCASSL